MAQSLKNTIPDVSLIIAVYNKPDFLEKILVSLLSQTFKNFEILISDDGSEKEIAELLDKYKSMFAHPIIHCWHPNKGFRKTIIANNSVKASHADYLVFIDGDCILHHRFLERHFIHRQLHTVLSGRRVLLDEKISRTVTKDHISSKKIESPLYWYNHCRQSDIKNGIYVPFSYEIENFFLAKYTILGSNFSVYKSDYYSINGYDERIIGRGMEDSNLYERFRKKGLRVTTLAREALQYHLFHSFDPVPHSKETIKQYCFPKNYWTDFGLIKKGD